MLQKRSEHKRSTVELSAQQKSVNTNSASASAGAAAVFTRMRDNFTQRWRKMKKTGQERKKRGYIERYTDKLKIQSFHEML